MAALFLAAYTDDDEPALPGSTSFCKIISVARFELDASIEVRPVRDMQAVRDRVGAA